MPGLVPVPQGSRCVTGNRQSRVASRNSHPHGTIFYAGQLTASTRDS